MSRPPKKKPVPLATRVRESELRKVQAGGRRLPGGMLPPDAAEALERLQAEQYGPSAAACIARALVEAAERITPAATFRQS